MPAKPVRVAAIQAAPVFLDLERSLNKGVSLIGQAAASGATLAAFGETFLPGYPAWLDLSPGAALWDHAPSKRAYSRLLENSVVVPGPATERLSEAARRHRMVVVMGVHERTGAGRGSLYNTQLIFGPDGALIGRHRKLVPTHAERLVWTPGDGGGLEAYDTPAGRVGTLICWEHWMPLARQALHESAEQVHVAAWPGIPEMYLVASRHYAFEGRCYVLAVGSIVAASDLPEGLEPPAGSAASAGALAVDGGSAIIAPDGALLAGPVHGREEILIADLDLGRIAEESLALDVAGHYSRPDIFELSFRSSVRRAPG
jgi:predicted amidohydrolase